MILLSLALSADLYLQQDQGTWVLAPKLPPASDDRVVVLVDEHKVTYTFEMVQLGGQEVLTHYFSPEGALVRYEIQRSIAEGGGYSELSQTIGGDGVVLSSASRCWSVDPVTDVETIEDCAIEGVLMPARWLTYAAALAEVTPDPTVVAPPKPPAPAAPPKPKGR